jgi:hypothetical protein
VSRLLLVSENDVARLRNAEYLSIADIRDASERLGVSHAVVVRRLADYDRTRHWLLVHLKRVHRGPWVFWRITGRVRGLGPSMDLLESEFRKLDDLPDQDVSIRLRARFGSVICDLEGHGEPGAGTSP